MADRNSWWKLTKESNKDSWYKKTCKSCNGTGINNLPYSFRNDSKCMSCHGEGYA